MTASSLDPARVARAARAIRDGDARVEPADDGTFRVRSFTTDAVEYRVRLDPRSCTCPDHRYRGVTTCKHVAAALLRGTE